MEIQTGTVIDDSAVEISRAAEVSPSSDWNWRDMR
jgi:hypothetical protein